MGYWNICKYVHKIYHRVSIVARQLKYLQEGQQWQPLCLPMTFSLRAELQANKKRHKLMLFTLRHLKCNLWIYSMHCKYLNLTSCRLECDRKMQNKEPISSCADKKHADRRRSRVIELNCAQLRDELVTFSPFTVQSQGGGESRMTLAQRKKVGWFWPSDWGHLVADKKYCRGNLWIENRNKSWF